MIIIMFLFPSRRLSFPMSRVTKMGRIMTNVTARSAATTHGKSLSQTTFPTMGLASHHKQQIMARYRTNFMSTSFTTSRIFVKQEKYFDEEDNNISYNTDSADSTETSSVPWFQPGDRIQVEILSFGPLGASVDIVASSHDPNSVIPTSEPALGRGLILQKEIQYFRESRGNLDVLRGEVIPAYIEKIRDDQLEQQIDGEQQQQQQREYDDYKSYKNERKQYLPPHERRYDICLREYGGRAKAESLASQIMARLQEQQQQVGGEGVGELPIGDKSPPDHIAREFPGASKGSFKKAVAALYKQGKVKPGPHSIKLIQ